MNRGTPEYIEAVQRVKISFLTENLGLDIRGILHVGTNDGYEMQWYRAMGIQNLAGVEPLPSAITLFRAHYPEIPLYECALGMIPGRAPLHVVTPGDGQGSSLLIECRPNPDYDYNTEVMVDVVRGDSLPLDWDLYDCLVMDVQGFELPALRGLGARLAGFRMLNIECSIEPVYVSGAPAVEVDAFLTGMGFTRMSPLEVHDDVFWVKR